jgi:amidase
VSTIDTLPTNDGAPVDAILSVTATMAEVGTRAGYPQVSIPGGYDPTARRPQSISSTDTAGDDAKLLGFGYAYERAALVRQTPSEVMPQTWHCVAPIVSIERTRSCGPGEVAPADVTDAVRVPAPVGGTVPSTLSLTLGAPASFGAFTQGMTKEYTAATTANVVSTALDATLTVSPVSATDTAESSNSPGGLTTASLAGHLMNGPFALSEPLRWSSRSPAGRPRCPTTRSRSRSSRP